MGITKFGNHHLRHTLIRNRTVIYIIDSFVQLFQTKLKSGASRQQLMLHIIYLVFLCPSLTFFSSAIRKIGPFGKEHQPHWVRGLIQFLQMFCQSWLIHLPVSFEEYKLRELHSPTQDRNFLQRLLQDNIHVAVQSCSISHPPEVQPICVDLMVRNQDEPFRKSAEQIAIRGLMQLSANALMAAHSDDRRCPALGHGHHKQSPRLFRESYPSVIPIFINEGEWSAESLRGIDSGKMKHKLLLSADLTKFIYQNSRHTSREKIGAHCQNSRGLGFIFLARHRRFLSC